MRTRFLTTHYFTTSQTLEFLRLPLPHLQPPPDSLSSSSSSPDFQLQLLRCVNSSSETLSLQLDSSPVQNALSKFLSDVLSHTIDTGDGAFPTSLRRHSTGVLHVPANVSDFAYEESETETCGASNSEILASKLAKERTEDTTGGKNENGPVILHLEFPELSQDLENASMSEKEKFQLLSEVQQCDDSLVQRKTEKRLAYSQHTEMLNMGLPDSYHCDINDSIDIIKARSPGYDMEQKTQIPEECFPLLSNVQTCESMLPLFEVDELGIEDFRWACVEDELHSFIVNIEVQHCTDNDNLEFNCQRVLGSVESDILELIDDHHTSKLPLDFHVETLSSAVDIDMIQVIETRAKRSTGMIDAYLFEELQMLDSDSFEIFEAHTICQITKEPEACDQLFHKDMNFKTFDGLIVRSELALINDSFISLPVPVIKDDKKSLSLHVIVTDIFPKLEPVPLSTSDEIYLDWHLLGKDKCSDDVIAAIEKVFNDVGNLTIDLSLKPDDGSMVVLDLLLSDDPLDCLNTTEKKLNMPSGGSCSVTPDISTFKSSSLSDDDCQIIEKSKKVTNAESVRATSGKLSDEDCQIIEETLLTVDDFGKSAPSLESMSRFNDLDFFLNPRKAAGNMKIDCRMKALDDTSVFSKGFHQRKATSRIQKQQWMSSCTLLACLLISLSSLAISQYLVIIENETRLNYPQPTQMT